MGAPDGKPPRRGKHDDGNRTDIDRTGTGSNSASNNPTWSTDAETSAAQSKALIRFALRTDGWLRIAPDGEASDVFLKWKWTRGRFTNKYVMVRCLGDKILWGVDMLERKVEEVELLLRMPVEDRFFH